MLKRSTTTLVGHLVISDVELIECKLIKAIYYLFMSHFAFGIEYDSDLKQIFCVIEQVFLDWTYTSEMQPNTAKLISDLNNFL